MTPTPVAEAEAPLISLADFQSLLATQHPFSLVLGIEVLYVGRGAARAVLPARDTHQRLGGIVAGPMLMGLADRRCTRPWWAPRGSPRRSRPASPSISCAKAWGPFLPMPAS